MMASKKVLAAKASRIRLQNVRVEIPIYGAPQHHSLKQKAIFLGTGGRLARETGAIPKVIALDDISLEIGPGARLGLKGHNGAGKTTLLPRSTMFNMGLARDVHLIHLMKFLILPAVPA